MRSKLLIAALPALLLGLAACDDKNSGSSTAERPATESSGSTGTAPVTGGPSGSSQSGGTMNSPTAPTVTAPGGATSGGSAGGGGGTTPSSGQQ